MSSKGRQRQRELAQTGASTFPVAAGDVVAMTMVDGGDDTGPSDTDRVNWLADAPDRLNDVYYYLAAEGCSVRTAIDAVMEGEG